MLVYAYQIALIGRDHGSSGVSSFKSPLGFLFTVHCLADETADTFANESIGGLLLGMTLFLFHGETAQIGIEQLECLNGRQQLFRQVINRQG